MDTAVKEYPELVQRYFMNKCVPAQDNKFSALHGAVWSGGAFFYVPKGVKVDLPLQSYFRMEGAGEGTFEHTLIVADEGARRELHRGLHGPDLLGQLDALGRRRDLRRTRGPRPATRPSRTGPRTSTT